MDSDEAEGRRRQRAYPQSARPSLLKGAKSAFNGEKRVMTMKETPGISLTLKQKIKAAVNGLPTVPILLCALFLAGCSAEIRLYVPATLDEGSGAHENAVMVVFPWRTQETVLKLSCSDSRVLVDSFVHIESGSRSVQFSLTMQDNDALDEAAVASITAEVDGFTAVTANVTIVDDENPDTAAE